MELAYTLRTLGPLILLRRPNVLLIRALALRSGTSMPLPIQNLQFTKKVRRASRRIGTRFVCSLTSARHLVVALLDIGLLLRVKQHV